MLGTMLRCAWICVRAVEMVGCSEATGLLVVYAIGSLQVS